MAQPALSVTSTCWYLTQAFCQQRTYIGSFAKLSPESFARPRPSEPIARLLLVLRAAIPKASLPVGPKLRSQKEKPVQRMLEGVRMSSCSKGLRREDVPPIFR